MTSLLKGDSTDNQIVTRTDTLIEEEHSVSLGAWTRHPLPSSLCPPPNQPTGISGVTAIDLIQSPQRDEHQILWTKGKWAENIMCVRPDDVEAYI